MSYGKDLYSEYGLKTCKSLELDPKLMFAIFSVESNWDPSAIRFEPAFSYILRPAFYAQSLKITEITERTLQQFSWGIGQIMGATARDCGMKGHLQSLSLPECGIYWSCVYMKRLVTRYPSVTDHIAAYNAGEPKLRSDGSYINQEYLDKVINLIKA